MRLMLLQWHGKLIEERINLGIYKKLADNVCCRYDGTPLKGIKSAWTSVRKNAELGDFHFRDLSTHFVQALSWQVDILR